MVAFVCGGLMSTEGKRIGYVVISKYQNIYDHPFQNMEFDAVYIEKISTRSPKRPEFEKMIADGLQPGDRVFIYEMRRTRTIHCRTISNHWDGCTGGSDSDFCQRRS